jgi:hypothetical protein
MRTILALFVLIAACDPCDAAARVHVERCNDGDLESCAWLEANVIPGSYTCWS